MQQSIKLPMWIQMSLFLLCFSLLLLPQTAEANGKLKGELLMFPAQEAYTSGDLISFQLDVENAKHTDITWEHYRGSPFAGTVGAKQTYPEGKHTVTATACTERTCQDFTTTFTVHNAPPRAPELQMSPEKNLKRNSYLLFSHGFGDDPDGDEVTFQWKVKGGKWSKTPPSGTFPVGKHTVYVRAKDSKGNLSDVTKKTFTVHNSAPTKPFLLLKPQKELYSTTKLSFHAASSDIDWDKFHYEWQVNNNQWSKKKPGGFFPEGKHTVRVRAIDKHGAKGEVSSVTFSVSNTPPSSPTIEIETEKEIEGSMTEITKVLFKVFGSIDLDNDEITYEWKIDSEKEKGTWSTKPLDGYFKRGTYTFYARAKDAKGTYSPIVNKTFTIKNVAPTVPTIEMEPRGDLTNIIELTFSGGGSIDMEGDDITYEWKVGDGDWLEGTPGGIFPGGSHVVLLRAKDAYGDYSDTTEILFTVATIAETVIPSIVISEKGKITKKTDLTFKAKPEIDDIVWEWKIDREIDGETMEGVWQLTPPNGHLDRGKYTVSIRAKDTFGDETKIVSSSFEVHNTPPSEPVMTVTYDAITKKPVFHASSVDPDGDEITYFWRVNDGNWSTTPPNNVLGEGEHIISLRVQDDYGGASIVVEKTVAVSLDETPDDSTVETTETD